MAPLANLGRVPEPAIIENIAARLPSDDLFALRSTNRYLQIATFDLFVKRYFQKKCVHFGTDSLKTLARIYSNPRFQGTLKELYISFQFFYELFLTCKCTTCGCKGWNPTVEQTEAYRTFLQDQVRLKADGDDLKLLVEAMKHIKRVKSITFVGNWMDLKDGIDHIGHQRIVRRVGPVVEYQFGTRRSAPSMNLYNMHQHHSFVSTLRAIYRSKLQVTHLGTCFTSSNDSIGDGTAIKPNAKFWQLSLPSITTISFELGGLYSSHEVIRAIKLLVNCASATLKFDGIGWSSELAMSVLYALPQQKLKYLWLKDVIFGGGGLEYFLAESALNLEVLKLECVGVLQPGWQSLVTTIATVVKSIRHLHILVPIRYRSRIFFMADRTESEQLLFETQIATALDPQRRRALYHENFTFGTFPGCDEAVEVGEAHCCTNRCHSRGYYICLATRHDIEAFLPSLAEGYRTAWHFSGTHSGNGNADPDDYEADSEWPSDSELEWAG